MLLWQWSGAHIAKDDDNQEGQTIQNVVQYDDFAQDDDYGYHIANNDSPNIHVV